MLPALPPPVARSVTGYRRLADRLLPGRVTGLYVVGSVALGAYRPARSDIDLVVVLDGPPRPDDLGRLRRLHLGSAAATAARSVRRGRSPLRGTCNAVFVHAADLTVPVTRIVPVAAAVGERVTPGAAGSDVSPVAWTVLADRGVVVRGPHPGTLGLDPEPHRLRAWNLDNLESYWRPLARHYAADALPLRLRPRWSTAWAVLGPPRLHRTVATGEVVSKEAAGQYALDVLDPRWRPLVRYALAYWREEPLSAPPPPRPLVAEYVEHVIESAHALR
ncbi:MAG TPA: aminoglycoside adenylyltransferase domain-containing protein [Pseudonocardia sp.]|nr:aminoglycoside adenylyltransferase domain-containing protein [Pseudonocardia sp.]